MESERERNVRISVKQTNVMGAMQSGTMLVTPSIWLPASTVLGAIDHGFGVVLPTDAVFG
jgi:hypothetical protein